MNIALIGCGGVGGWLAPALKGYGFDVTYIDGDTVEAKNIGRQTFNVRHIGLNKAEVFHSLFGGDYSPRYITQGWRTTADVIIIAVDNSLAKLAALEAADVANIPAIICGNEITTAEAWLNLPNCKGKVIDYRVYYPSVMTDKSNDPQAISCSVVAPDSVVEEQSIAANMYAASAGIMLLHLYLANYSVPIRINIGDGNAYSQYAEEFI